MESRTYYNPATGQIITSVYGHLDFLDLSTYAAYPYINQYTSDIDFYVEREELIRMPKQPSEWHKFDYVSKTWINTASEETLQNKTKKEIALKRKYFLQESDWTQIPNNPLTAEQQQAWAVYRQELRDITMQPGYPFNVVWPTPPQG